MITETQRHDARSPRSPSTWPASTPGCPRRAGIRCRTRRSTRRRAAWDLAAIGSLRLAQLLAAGATWRRRPRRPRRPCPCCSPPGRSTTTSCTSGRRSSARRWPRTTSRSPSGCSSRSPPHLPEWCRLRSAGTCCNLRGLVGAARGDDPALVEADLRGRCRGVDRLRRDRVGRPRRGGPRSVARGTGPRVRRALRARPRAGDVRQIGALGWLARLDADITVASRRA